MVILNQGLVNIDAQSNLWCTTVLVCGLKAQHMCIISLQVLFTCFYKGEGLV